MDKGAFLSKQHGDETYKVEYERIFWNKMHLKPISILYDVLLVTLR